MKLLIVTQSVDTNDPVLGFFHRWIEAWAKQVDSIEVICLRKGIVDLPGNVRVHSLGKEKGRQYPLTYAVRFLALVWKLQNSYDSAFVHMNQEYVLLAGVLWRLLGKRIYLWRNHYAGSWLTDLSVILADNVFCTSRLSYTAHFRKTKLMPVGVDTERFTSRGDSRTPHSILFLGRIAPSKRPDLLLDALTLLSIKGVAYTASFYGSPRSEEGEYYASLKAHVEKKKLSVTFHPALTHGEAAQVYRTHEIFVNASPSGMLDKTIFEALASGSAVLASSEDFANLVGEGAFFTNAEDLAGKLETLLRNRKELVSLREAEILVVEGQSLTKLMEGLGREVV